MRLVKFVGVLLVVLAFQVSYGQTQPENGGSPSERSFIASIHIFPNPAVEYVHIKVDELPATQVKLALHNILGNQMDIETEVVDEHELRIKVKELASGYYLLAIKDERTQNRGMFKFLKR
jgi:hypothetical protein